MLRPPHWDNLFILQVDASSCGVGAILSQLDGEGLEHPIVFASIGSCRNEVNNREGMFSSSGGFGNVSMYNLFGRRFKLQTDHNPFVWLNQVKNKNRKLSRRSLTLQEYDIEIEHKTGERHVNVNALSRLS